MTPEAVTDPVAERGWLAFYRLQARLMWQWRPGRLAILRRALLSFLGACLALAIAAGVVPGLQVDGLAPLMLAGLLLVALDSTLAVVLHGLLVGLPIFFAQALGLSIDADPVPGQMGTLAGDDTVFVAVLPERRADVMAHLVRVLAAR